MITRSMLKFLAHHYKDTKSQRLGQRFCNEYIKSEFPELFYATDEKAKDIIQKWLRDHQYIHTLPMKVR